MTCTKVKAKSFWECKGLLFINIYIYIISNPKVWGLKILLTHIIYKAQTQTQSQTQTQF